MGNKKQKNLTNPMIRRIITIHNIINSKKYPNSTTFMEETEMSIATIRRDLDVLRYTFDAPLKYDETHKGYYYDYDFELPFVNNDEDNFEIIASAKMLLENYKGTFIYDKLSSLLLSTITPQNPDKSFLDRFALAPREKSIIDKEILKTITSSLKENKVLEIRYCSRFSKEDKNYTLHPFQLVFDEGKIYLYALDVTKNITKLFLIQRIKKIKVLKETFDLPENFKFEEKAKGGKFGAFATDETYNFKIEFYSDSRSIIKDFAWSENQKTYDDPSRDCTTIEFSSSAWYAVLSWVLQNGENAKPIEPDWFVAEWHEKVRRMAELV